MARPTVEGHTFILQELFEDASYDIDYYQREFAWPAEAVRDLVVDLATAFEARSREPYFLGPFVYHEERRRVRFLVDGQQRFTTLHLLFLHLRRRAIELDERSSTGALDRVIRYWDNGTWRYRIDIEERRDALDAFYEGRPYEPKRDASLSLRALCVRSEDIREQLEENVGDDELPSFVTWLLAHVVLVGIKAPSRDSGFRIFESMNDRGARLTPVDLVKSFLLTEAEQNQESLNIRWREMLAELTSARENPSAPSEFLKSFLIANHARFGESYDDVREIGDALHMWVRKNAAEHLDLKRSAQFAGFIDQLTRAAGHHRMFLAASRRPDFDNELAAVYYNERNGLTNQMAFILAATKPEDSQSVARAKGRLVANFIDRWYVDRVVSDGPALARDLDLLMPDLIPMLRKCRDDADVATALSSELNVDDSFANIDQFGIRGNNVTHVRYLLARLTAFVETGWKEPDRSEEYLSNQRTWQIEHIFANHAERHPEVADPRVFRRLRDSLGALVLLPSTVNTSLQDQLLGEKLRVYVNQNLLARCLHPDFQRNNKFIKNFVKDHDLKHYMRPLGPKPDLLEAVTVRQELYRRLCAALWSRDRLGFSTSTHDDTQREVEKRSFAPPRRGRRTQLAMLVDDGVIAPGTRLVGGSSGQDVWAEVDADGWLRLSTGQRFRKADDAGREVTGKRCAGMSFWHVQNASGARTSLGTLKKRFDAERRHRG